MENTAPRPFTAIVNGTTIYGLEAGSSVHQAILFLHGYPQTGKTFEKVMTLLQNEYYMLAIDLPGIGRSQEITGTDKKTIAAFVQQLLNDLNLNNPVVAGHDIGGMVTFSLLQHFPPPVSKAIIMNTAVPGVEPWEAVKRNPYIWHFAFYAVPGLPEQLIDGKQRALFDYFYDTLAARKTMITEEHRQLYAEAYKNNAALKTSLGWYRTFPQDEKDNAAIKNINIPVLYLRGDKDPGKMEDYLYGLKKHGLAGVTGKQVANSGHFAPEEAPEAVATLIREFL